jgi:hypothetical protein
MKKEASSFPDLGELYDALPGGIGEIPYSPQVPVSFSLDIPGISSGNYEKYRQETLHGSVGKKIAELRDRGFHVATQVRPNKVVFWASEHRPLITATVATALTLSTAAGVILYRKSRQKHHE